MADKNDWLKKSLQDKFDSEKAPVSDELWGMIEPRIKAPKKKRRFIWLWFLLGALGLTSLGFLVWSEADFIDRDYSKDVPAYPVNKKVEKLEEVIVIDNNDAKLLDENSTNKNAKSENKIVGRESKINPIYNNSKSTTVFNLGPENNPIVTSNEVLTRNSISFLNETIDKVNIENKNSENSEDNPSDENAKGLDNISTKPFNISGIGLISLKQEELFFNRVFDFPFHSMRMMEVEEDRKGNWYMGLSYARHRQLIYPNKDDRILISENSNGTDTIGIFQWGAALHLGRTFLINDQFNWFAEASFGFNILEHAYAQRILSDERFAELLADQMLRLGISSDYSFRGKSARFIYPGLALGLNYQPLKQLPIIISAGLYGQYNFSKNTDMMKNHVDYGGQLELGWDIDKKKKFNVGLRSEFQFNKSDWMLYKGRRQSARILLKYNF